MSDPARRALVGGGIGALAGAGIGAVKNKEDRKAGALKGAVGGGLLGSLAGGLHGRFKPAAPGPTTIHAQALDNTAPDWIGVRKPSNVYTDWGKNTELKDTKAREEAVSAISSTAKRGKPAFEYAGHKVMRTGRHYLAELDMSHWDERGRRAPIAVHGTWTPGMSENEVLRDAIRAAYDVPTRSMQKAKTTSVDPSRFKKEAMNTRMFSSFVKTAMELQADQDTPGDYTAIRAAVAAKLKLASVPGNAPRFNINHLELAGLGTIAAPAAAGLAGAHPSEKTKEVAEVAGLGMLAAPYVHNIAARRNARYATSRAGQYLTRAFAH